MGRKQKNGVGWHNKLCGQVMKAAQELSRFDQNSVQNSVGAHIRLERIIADLAFQIR